MISNKTCCNNCCKKVPLETNCFCSNECKTCCLHGFKEGSTQNTGKDEPMQTDQNEIEYTFGTINDGNKGSFITNVQVSPGSQYPITWLKLLKNGVNNISFNQVIGNKDEPLYTVLGFFPDKLQVTIDTSLITPDTVRTFVHSNKIIITGQKLECSTMENVAGCREIEVTRTIMIPLPMKHAQSKATIMENANVYMLIVEWDIPF